MPEKCFLLAMPIILTLMLHFHLSALLWFVLPIAHPHLTVRDNRASAFIIS